MIFNDLNLNHLRIFESVFRHKSMTEAAKELHLTQSGVSQHMTSLEEALGFRLFDRVKQRLIPTSIGQNLYDAWTVNFKKIEEALWEMKGDDKVLKGVVSFGVPVEFGNNMILPLVAQFARKNPLVKYKIRLEFASVLNEMLLGGKIDFAFIDEFKMDPSIKVKKVFDEILELCMLEDLLKEKGSPRHTSKFYETLDYVEYEEGEPILKMWFQHHLGEPKLKLNVKAHVADAQSNSRLILSGVGAGVLPGHLVSRLEKDGHSIHTFKGSGKPLKNTISLAYVDGRTQSPAASALLDSLVTSLEKNPRN
ncbi:MAG: LysR family transcriptional regulator [Bdellovibrionia bacterium]